MFKEETGEFFWRPDPTKSKRWNGRFAGKPAFTSRDKDGYLISTFTNPETGKRARFRAHRIAWVMIHGAHPEHLVDHINGDRGDNRAKNLRSATDAQNKANTRNNYGSSKFQGVHFHQKTGKWRAMIRVAGKSKHVGLFPTEEDAAKARDAAASRQYGEFAHLNRAHRLPPF